MQGKWNSQQYTWLWRSTYEILPGNRPRTWPFWIIAYGMNSENETIIGLLQIGFRNVTTLHGLSALNASVMWYRTWHVKLPRELSSSGLAKLVMAPLKITSMTANSKGGILWSNAALRSTRRVYKGLCEGTGLQLRYTTVVRYTTVLRYTTLTCLYKDENH